MAGVVAVVVGEVGLGQVGGGVQREPKVQRQLSQPSRLRLALGELRTKRTLTVSG